MNALDAVVAALAGLGSVSLGLRSQMLKPHLGRWPDAPRIVQLAVFQLSLIMGGYAAAVINGHSATPTEACLVASVAIAGVTLWLNLEGQRGRISRSI